MDFVPIVQVTTETGLRPGNRQATIAWLLAKRLIVKGS
jgi:hypothetical protein